MEFKKTGNEILIGDFVGTCSDSPSGIYSIGWYCAKTRGWMDAKNYVLLKSAVPIVWGEIGLRIYEGKAADNGRFALHLIGKTNQSTLRLFESNGQELVSKQFREGLIFFDLSSNGQFLFWNSRDNLFCVELPSMTSVFQFQLEPRFNPTAVKWDSDSTNVLVQCRGKEWYRFEQTGAFLDKERWFLDYIKDCDGQSLCQIVSDLYKKQGAKDAEEAKTYAEWIEDALRRGIADSYSFKVSQVYEFLATLYDQVGDQSKMSFAKEEAEKRLDGFTLVERAMSRFKEIGNPPNQTLARQLIDDLERATQTPRLLEYPNFVGKLYRTKGEIFELLEENEAAATAYQKALEANPQAGCKKQLEHLTKAPVIIPERPKPPPIEERIHLDKLTMFHFRCPTCGATPKELSIMDYLEGWRESQINRLYRLFAVLLSATQELKESKANSTKKFLATADDLLSILGDRLKDKPFAQTHFLVNAAPKTMFLQAECPVCEKPSGLRRKDNYFTIWSEACRVQSSNLFFELGAILFGLTVTQPPWLDADNFNHCKFLMSKIFRAGEAIGLMPCPQCGRFTSCLYGGTRSEINKGMCRWCLDSSEANQITISLNIGGA